MSTESRNAKPRDVAGLSNPKATIITAPTLLVADIDRSTAFYRDQVELELYRTNEGFANFKMGDLILALWQLDHVQGAIEYEADILKAKFYRNNDQPAKK